MVIAEAHCFLKGEQGLLVLAGLAEGDSQVCKRKLVFWVVLNGLAELVRGFLPVLGLAQLQTVVIKPGGLGRVS